MANTRRTEAELLALFRNNKAGQIDAQDVRDFVVSTRIDEINDLIESGFQGAQGNQGAIGVGAQGAQGKQGTSGVQGSQGNTGGAQGAAGSQGSQGVQGTNGTIGSNGAQGSQGATGPNDYSPVVILAPDSDARNVIQPTASTVKALVIKGAASQSDNLTEWQNNSSTVLAKVDNAGLMTQSKGEVASVYRGTFSSVTGNQIINHNLNVSSVCVSVYDNSSLQIIPDEVYIAGSSTVHIDLTSYGTFTGFYIIVG